jgi:exopolysaccharide production protein ExoQ
MSPQSVREPIRHGGQSLHVRSRDSGSRGLNWLTAAAVWLLIVPASVDFTRLFAGLGGTAVTADTSPNATTRLLKTTLILISTLIVASRVPNARALLRRVNPFFLAFLGLALASVAWSVDPDVTLARCITLSATVLVSIAFCLVGWYRERFQDIVRPLLTIVLAGSLIYIVMAPDLAIDFDKAGYHGLSSQKNPFGEICAIGTLLWMHALISGEQKRWKAVAGAAIGWSCLWLSKSATSLLATILASFFLFMLINRSSLMRRYTPHIVTIFAILVVTYALAVLNIVPGLATLLLSPIMAVTGKDMTFTNRTAIWQIVKEHAELHPILGTGYGAYWTAPVPTSHSYVMLVRLYFWPSESHNGYLDIYNDLGFVGLICLMGYLTIYVRQALQFFRFDRAQAALYLALFFQQAVTNLSESCWLAANGVLPVVIVTLATCALARGLLDQQRARQTAMRSFVAPRR